MYLLGTNACLDFLLARTPLIGPHMAEAFGRLAVSAMTAAALRVGSRASQNPEGDDRRIDLFLTGVKVLPFDGPAAAAYGELAASSGVRDDGFDRLIAAHALSADATLVTNNGRDFTDIAGLRVENWTR